MSQDSIVEIVGLQQRFGRRARTVTALAGVDLCVRRGEIFGLLGRNGAGKTTLVKALLGLLRPSSGTVRVFGREPGEAGARARIGYSPEEPGFPRYLYPRQVLELCGALNGMSGAALTAAVERQLTSSELQSVAARQARQLSKGMLQRLSLAQAFLHEPELLVLDEPTADLDPIGRRQVRDLIVAARERGATVLLNSHLLSEVERMCDRIAVIHGGRVIREGALDDLLSGDRELEDVFIELIESAGGGTGYGPAGGWASPLPPPASRIAPPHAGPGAAAVAGRAAAHPRRPPTPALARPVNGTPRTIALIARATVVEQANRRLLWWLAGVALALVVGLALLGVFHPLAGLGTRETARLFARSGAGIYTLITVIILGMGIVGYDLESGAAIMFLSRPVSRGEYLTGRYLGNALTLAATLTVMGVGTFLVSLAGGRADWTLLYDFVVLAWNAAVVLAVMVALTVIAGMIAAAIIGFLTWEVVGNTYLLVGLIHAREITGIGARLLTAAVILMPHVLSSPLVAGTTTSFNGGLTSFVLPGPTLHDLAWSAAWVVGSLLLATILFERRAL